MTNVWFKKNRFNLATRKKENFLQIIITKKTILW